MTAVGDNYFSPEMTGAKLFFIAELLAGLGAHGHLSQSYTELGQVAVKLVSVQGNYHHYPILFFFRFEEPYYAVSSIALVALDTITLIKSGLDDEEYAWLKESAAAAQLRRAALRLTTTLMDAFMGRPARPARRHCRRDSRPLALSLSGGAAPAAPGRIQTIADEAEDEETYVALRSKWDYLIAHLAPRSRLHDGRERSGRQRSTAVSKRLEFESRLHSSE